MELFLQQLVNGLALGGIYCLAALGLTLVFGVLRIPNLAHGTLYMLGVYVTYSMMTSFGVPYIAAIGIAAIVLACIGVLIERLVFNPLQGQPHTSYMIAAVGLMFFFQSSAQVIWGADFRRMPAPLPGNVEIGGVSLSIQRLLIIVVAIVVTIALTVFLKRSVHGQSIEAIEQDRTGSSLVGINPSRVSMMTLGLAAALAAIAAGLVAPINMLSPTMSASLDLKIFAIIILGGLGSVPGAIIGSFGLAIAESLGSTYVSALFGDAVAFIVLLVVLAIRPTGLFSKAVQR